MRPIDADELRDIYSSVPNGVYTTGHIITAIDECKTIDAAPVKHGRWEGDETSDAYDIAGVKTWAVKRKCSECGFTHRFIEAHMCYVFCPNCGARMDGEADDHR